MALVAVVRRLSAAAALAAAAASAAADIKVLTAGAYKPVLQALAPAFELRSGHHLVVDNDTAGALQKRIAGGEAFDVVVLPPAALVALGARVGPALPLARVQIGIAVKAGAPLPDISTAAAFQRTLLDARAVATIDPAAGGSSGVYLWQLFDRLGIAAQLRPRAVLVPGGLVALKVVSGEADVAVHQVSEILAVPGAVLVGPIPAEVQNETVYAGAVAAGAADRDAARALLEHLAGPQALPVLQQKGMLAP